MIPESCIECPNNKTCKTFYGWNGCLFEGEINSIRIRKERNLGKKNIRDASSRDTTLFDD